MTSNQKLQGDIHYGLLKISTEKESTFKVLSLFPWKPHSNTAAWSINLIQVHCKSHVKIAILQGFRERILLEVTLVRTVDLKHAKNLSKTPTALKKFLKCIPSELEWLKKCILRDESTHFSQFLAGAGSCRELFVVVPLGISRPCCFTLG